MHLRPHPEGAQGSRAVREGLPLQGGSVEGSAEGAAMMLGRSHDSIYGPLWSAAKWLELCPVGTVVRNGCDHRAPAGEGTHLIKVAGDAWAPCNPRTLAVYKFDSGDPPVHARSKDVWLPVQVVRRGTNEE